MVGESAAATDLFMGVHEAINAHLGVTDYRTKTAARLLNTRAPKDFVGENLVKGAFALLRANWQRALPKAKASHQNFRWRYPQLALAGQNTSPEVTLERALMRACEDTARHDWCNQIPIISGVMGSHAYKRRAIDLVHRSGNGFEFVELKVVSDTPLYATVEILLYGMLWLLSRESRMQLGYPSNPILDTRTVQLSTLAPATFYANLMPLGFADAINRGISELGRQHGVGMGFRLTAFPHDFRWPQCDGHAELFHWFDDRVAVNQCV